MEIFKLFGSILVDSSEAEKSISKTGKEAEALGDKLKKGIETAGKWAAGIAAGAVAIGGAMVAAAKDTASAADAIDKASQRMGIGAEEFQILEHQANLCGVSMSTMEKAAKKLDDDMSFDQAMAEIYALEDANDRAKKAAELFGDAVAYEMTPMLNASAEEMKAMEEEALSLGLVMSEDSVKSGAAMNDMFGKIEESVGALKNNLMAEFMPYIMEILQWVLDEAPVIIGAIKKVLDFIMPYLKPILEGIMALLDGFAKLIDGDLKGFMDGVKTFFGNLAKTVFNLAKTVMSAVWDGLKDVWAGIKNWVSEKVSWLTDKLAFWRKGNKEMSDDSVDGKHASGLNYVPYDGYTAELHRGESVMNAGAMDRLMQKLENLPVGGGNGPIELTINLDGKAFAKATYSALQGESKRQGRSLVMV